MPTFKQQFKTMVITQCVLGISLTALFRWGLWTGLVAEVVAMSILFYFGNPSRLPHGGRRLLISLGIAIKLNIGLAIVFYIVDWIYFSGFIAFLITATFLVVVVWYCILLAKFPKEPEKRLNVVRATAGLAIGIVVIWFMKAVWARSFALEGMLFALSLGLSVILGYVVQRRRSATTESVIAALGNRRFRVRTALLTVLLWWVISSEVDPFWVNRKIYRNKPVAIKLEDDSTAAICLSGGGYRAALFHAGVLYQLNQSNIYPNYVSSVSGGSIIASFYTAGGNPIEFCDLVCDGRFNLSREMCNARNVARMVFSSISPARNRRGKTGLLGDFHYEFTRSNVQAGIVGRLIDYAKTSNYRDGSFSRPKLLVCATDMDDGSMYGFAPGMTVTRALAPAVRRLEPGFDPSNGTLVGHASYEVKDFESREVSDELWPLSKVVAASGAFPGALPPLPVRNGYTLLSDGGLRDNLGLRMLLDAREFPTYVTSETRKKVELREVYRTGTDVQIEKCIRAQEPNLWSYDYAKKVSDAVNNRQAKVDRLDQELSALRRQAAEIGDWQMGLIIVSNASAISTSQSLDTPFAQFGRMVDLIYDNQQSPTDGVNLSALAVVVIDPHVLVEKPIDWVVDRRDWEFDKHHTQSFNDSKLAEALGKELKNIFEGVVGEIDTPCGALAAQHSGPLSDPVRLSIHRGLVAFVNMSTLDDHPPAESAKAVFDLGRWAAIAKLGEIKAKRATSRPTTTKPA